MRITGQRPRDPKLRLSDVKELFELMKEKNRPPIDMISG
jgi:hypothetical protein